MIIRSKSVSDDYFGWIYSKVKNRNVRVQHVGLCRLLYNKEFRWFVPNDGNRIDDALELRERFVQARDIDQDHLEVSYFLRKPCSVLEVLVALAERINDLQYSLSDPTDYTEKWFHILLNNLSISEYTDVDASNTDLSPVDEAIVDDILETMMSRTYDFYGNGGLFPLKKRPPRNQAEVEIWYQMMLYLAENYV